MKKDFGFSIFAILILMFLALFYIGCSLSTLEQNQKNTLEPPQKPEPTPAKKGESIFTVIEIEDIEYPTLAAAIRLPFRVNPNNTVILEGKHAYVTTEKHLHVIDVSTPQLPSYLTTLVFPSKIGKVLASGNTLVVTSPKKFYTVDVSQPSQPTIQSTNYLPEQRNAIKDIDIRDDHLYVLGESDSLHVFSLHTGNARHVISNKLMKRWWLLSPEAETPKVKQIPLSTTPTIPSVLSDPLISKRGFLQLHSSRGEKVRASSNFLVMESLRDPTCDLLISTAEKLNDYSQSQSLGYFKVDWGYREHLQTTGEKTIIRGKPTNTYVVNSGKMLQIAQNSSSKEIDVHTKKLMGSVTDFQILENMLYIVNAKGFFSIYRLSNEGKTWFSTTPLQASRPLSIAIGKNFAYVLSTQK